MGIPGLIVIVVAWLGVAAGISALVALLVMALWNFAVVSAFHAPTLDFLHAWAIVFLISLVTGGIGRASKS